MEILVEEMRRFNYLTGEINSTYHEASLKLGLSDSATMILYVLYSGGSCLLSDFCRLTGLSRQTINSALRKLEADGTVRLDAADKKQKIAGLTPAGKRLAKSTVAKLIAAENRIFERWSPRERDEYLRLTQEYLSALQDEIESF